MNTKFQGIKVPVSWCALSLKLKRRKQSLYTYQTCFKLAKESRIKDEDDFKAVYGSYIIEQVQLCTILMLKVWKIL